MTGTAILRKLIRRMRRIRGSLVVCLMALITVGVHQSVIPSGVAVEAWPGLMRTRQRERGRCVVER